MCAHTIWRRKENRAQSFACGVCVCVGDCQGVVLFSHQFFFTHTHSHWIMFLAGGGCVCCILLLFPSRPTQSSHIKQSVRSFMFEKKKACIDDQGLCNTHCLCKSQSLICSIYATIFLVGIRDQKGAARRYLYTAYKRLVAEPAVSKVFVLIAVSRN